MAIEERRGKGLEWDCSDDTCGACIGGVLWVGERGRCVVLGIMVNDNECIVSSTTRIHSITSVLLFFSAL